uniref:ZP domain-containing protein n=1 Tax=Steinernema glaseri TaxID=37863 RepID=A0A1I7ZVZ6_9BILA
MTIYIRPHPLKLNHEEAPADCAEVRRLIFPTENYSLSRFPRADLLPANGTDSSTTIPLQFVSLAMVDECPGRPLSNKVAYSTCDALCKFPVDIRLSFDVVGHSLGYQSKLGFIRC